MTSVPPPADPSIPHTEGTPPPPSAQPSVTHEAPADPAKRIDTDGVPGRVPWKAIAVYCAIALIGAWIAMLPLWLSGTRIADADMMQFQLLTLAMMYTPTIAALVAVFAVQRPDKPARMLGLRGGSVGSTIVLVLIAWIVPAAVNLIGAAIAGAIGAFPADFANNSLLVETMTQQMPPGSEIPPAPVLMAIFIFNTVVFQIPLASIAAFGEELGWRGFLTPALHPLGLWPMVGISSLIWGVWHAPLILLGYNFGDSGWLGVLLMCVFCLCIGTFFVWLRLRSRTVWPAVIGHGAINATAATGVLLFGQASGDQSLQLSDIWPAWVIMLVIGVALLLSLSKGQARRREIPSDDTHAPAGPAVAA